MPFNMRSSSMFIIFAVCAFATFSVAQDEPNGMDTSRSRQAVQAIVKHLAGNELSTSAAHTADFEAKIVVPSRNTAMLIQHVRGDYGVLIEALDATQPYAYARSGLCVTLDDENDDKVRVLKGSEIGVVLTAQQDGDSGGLLFNVFLTDDVKESGVRLQLKAILDVALRRSDLVKYYQRGTTAVALFAKEKSRIKATFDVSDDKRPYITSLVFSVDEKPVLMCSVHYLQGAPRRQLLQLSQQQLLQQGFSLETINRHAVDAAMLTPPLGYFQNGKRMLAGEKFGRLFPVDEKAMKAHQQRRMQDKLMEASSTLVTPSTITPQTLISIATMPLTEVREQLVLPDASSGRRSINWLYDRSKASRVVQDSIGESNQALLCGLLSRIIMKDGIVVDVQRLAIDILGDLGCDTSSDMYREALASVKQKDDLATTTLMEATRVRLGERLPNYDHLRASISNTSLPLWVRLRAIEALAFADQVPDADKMASFLRDLWTSEAGAMAQAEVDIHRCIYGLAQSDSGFESLANVLKSKPSYCDLAMILTGLHNAATSEAKRQQVEALTENLSSDVAKLPVSLVERMAWTTVIPNSSDEGVRTFIDECLGDGAGKERMLIGFKVLSHRQLAVEYLSELGKKLQSNDPDIRAGATELLRQCARAESALARSRGLALIDQALGDRVSTVRVAALYSLGGYFVASKALDREKYVRKLSAMMKQAQDVQEIKTLARGIAALSAGKFGVAEPRDSSGRILLGQAQQQWWKANASVVKRQALAWAAEAGYSNGEE